MIYVEKTPLKGLGLAIMDRLKRAEGGKDKNDFSPSANSPGLI
jgi:hypothetical protein